MTQVNVSGFGTSVNIVASNTFPQGFSINQFSDDADSLDMPELAIADSGMGTNGTHVVWSKPGVMDLTTNIVPNSTDDVNLGILYEANRLAEGKVSANDVITMTINYPDGSVLVLKEGIIISGMPIKSLAQTGRLKTRPYKFRFANKSETA